MELSIVSSSKWHNSVVEKLFFDAGIFCYCFFVRFRDGENTGANDKELWAARKLCEAAIHPITQGRMRKEIEVSLVLREVAS